ncbi:MAG TPA: BrnA antitoxin family protein [Rhizomicrobium sp.]|nr:BrnA antitoxin family protein [Rhizomicrobium sp.]
MAAKAKARRADLDEIPEMTPADFARARRMRDVMPDVVAAMKRGRPKSATPKERVSLRLDPKILAAYKATGPGWQRRIAEALAHAASELKTARTKKRAA